MTLENLLRIGKLKAHAADEQEIARLLDSAERALAADVATRDFMEKLRETGVQTGGPAPLDHADRKRFADQLDRFLARRGKEPGNP